MTICAAILLASPMAPLISTTSHFESPTASQSVHELVVQAPSPAVWEAVSTSDGWTGWAATKAWSLPSEPDVIETSYDPKAAPGAPSNIKSRIVLKVPERLLAFRTIKAPEGFRDYDALSAVVWVIEIEPTGQGATRMKLTGSGFPRTAAGKRIQDFFLAHNPVALKSLSERFTTARTADAGQ